MPCIVCIADRLQRPAVIPGVLSAEFTGFYTPAAPQPIARVTAITHRNGAVFQATLTAIGGEWPPTENHILKQLS